MKAIKFLVKAVVVIAVIVIVALLLMPIWFGPVVKTAANAAVPGVVKTDFRLGHLHLNPYTARFELGDMQLSNPKGYSEKYAVTLGDIIFDAKTLSLMTDVIHIEEITVKDVFVSVVSGGENEVLNFRQIQYNVAGGKEKCEAAEAEKQKADEEEAEKIRAEEMQNPKAADEEKAKLAEKEKRIVIDKLHISGLKIQLGFLPISVPVTIELADIGKDSGGATFEEAWQQIWEGILKSAGIAGEQLKALGNLTGDAAKQATEAAAKAATQATEAASKATAAATEAAGKATAAATESVGKAASAVSDSAASATKAAGDATKAAGDATKAVGDAAGKALDSLKKLW